MNIALLATIVSSQCIIESCIYYEYLFPPPRSGVQAIFSEKDRKHFIFSGRKSSTEYVEGLSIFTRDPVTNSYHVDKDVSIDSPPPRSHYGLFDADQKWMYLF